MESASVKELSVQINSNESCDNNTKPTEASLNNVQPSKIERKIKKLLSILESIHKSSSPIISIPGTEGGVSKQILVPGEGEEYPFCGDLVSCNYITYQVQGDGVIEIDSKWTGQSLEFNLGRRMVNKGWDMGLATMKKNEEAFLIVQPEYAVGDKSYQVVPNRFRNTRIHRIKLNGWTMEDLSPEKDRSILRKIVQVGKGQELPNDGSKVKVKLIGTCNNFIFYECEKEFILGEDCQKNIPEGLELALYKFWETEKSHIYLKHSSDYCKKFRESRLLPDADLVYEATLLSFTKVKERWEMNSDEKFERSKLAREKGTHYIKAGEFKVALRQLSWIISCLEDEPGVAPEDRPSRAELLFIGYMNSSLCLLKLKRFFEAHQMCDKALEMDPKNEKALFRRGQARLGMNDFPEAFEDFKTVCTIYPENKLAKQYMLTCEEKEKLRFAKDKNVYGNMFEKFKNQDEKRRRLMEPETGVWGDEKIEEKPTEKKYINEAHRLLEQNRKILEDANILTLSNTAI